MRYETRRNPRFKIDLGIQCVIPAGSGQSFALASGDRCEMTAADISEKGMGLISEYFFPRGLIVILEVQGKEFGLAETMILKAKVCHSRSQGRRSYFCGVQFMELLPKYQKAIDDFIVRHDQRQFPRIKLAD